MAIELKDLAEPSLVIWTASTIRVVMQYIKKWTVSIAHVILQYTCGAFAWYIAYKTIPQSNFQILYVSIIVLLSRDIVEWIISKEWREKVRDLILQSLK